MLSFIKDLTQKSPIYPPFEYQKCNKKKTDLERFFNLGKVDERYMSGTYSKEIRKYKDKIYSYNYVQVKFRMSPSKANFLTYIADLLGYSSRADFIRNAIRKLLLEHGFDLFEKPEKPEMTEGQFRRMMITFTKKKKKQFKRVLESMLIPELRVSKVTIEEIK